MVEVAVHQAWQQQGIGRMLLERVIESAIMIIWKRSIACWR
ncbi:GNAT family N-acetyltransferase [Morganella morganii]